MLLHSEIQRAVSLQSKGYGLLKWIETAIAGGFVSPQAVHAYSSMHESAHAWLSAHYENLPHDARPERADLEAFGRLFSTYLVNTFDLDANPGERRYSSNAHCFCPMCSWMVRIPHLRPKKLGPADKKRADVLKRAFVRQLAINLGSPKPDHELDALLADSELREIVGLCTYAADLLQRMEGVAVGPASLALWRSFAWTPKGSPKKGFVLSATEIMKAQEALTARIQGGG
jgi:hypothetical protein